MALSVSLYKLGKNKNSTATVDTLGVAAFATFQCTLKAPTSITKPVLEFRFSQLDPLVLDCNYVVVPGLGRYYFINDWTNVGGNIWEASCIVDALGTWRDIILASTQFVVRAEKGVDGNIVDKLAVGRTVVNYGVSTTFSPWLAEDVDNWIVVQVLGSNNNLSNYYRMSSAQFKQFLQFITSDDFLDGIVDDWKVRSPDLRANFNVLNYIGSVKRFPLAISSTSNSPVYVANVNCGSAAVIDAYHSAYQELTIRFTNIPTHPQIGSIPFVKSSPYSEYYMFMPPFTPMPLDPVAVYNSSVGITCKIRVDVINGEGHMFVYGENANGLFSLLGTSQAQIGLNVAISNMESAYFGPLNAMVSGIGIAKDLISGAAKLKAGDVFGAAEGFFGAVDTLQGVYGDMTPKMWAAGSNDANAIIGMEPTIYARFQNVKSPPAHFIGLPLYESRVLNTLMGGFIACQNPEMDYTPIQSQGVTVPVAEEIRMIESYMSGGMYLE